MTPVELTRVLPCRCPEHARVLLHDRAGGRYLQVRVHADVGRAILAALHGVEEPHGHGLDVLRAVLAGLDARAESLTLSSDGERLDARLALRAPGGTVTVALEPCGALLAACRLRLPIFVGEFRGPPPAADGVPEAYRAFLAELDLSVLDGPSDPGS
ncbi:MAG TPA: bifunctional nuclease domain-containing protein [Dehalococcoidia bacterium]